MFARISNKQIVTKIIRLFWPFKLCWIILDVSNHPSGTCKQNKKTLHSTVTHIFLCKGIRTIIFHLVKTPKRHFWGWGFVWKTYIYQNRACDLPFSSQFCLNTLYMFYFKKYIFIYLFNYYICYCCYWYLQGVPKCK